MDLVDLEIFSNTGQVLCQEELEAINGYDRHKFTNNNVYYLSFLFWFFESFFCFYVIVWNFWQYSLAVDKKIA